MSDPHPGAAADGASPPRRRVLLVGWDAADWRVINPLLDAGRLPSLARLVERGAMGDLVSVNPSIAAVSWTTVATGMRADRHGILAEREQDPVSGDWLKTSCRHRATKALWNIVTERGLRSLVVNWAATHPAEPIRGVCVDERITSVTAAPGADWPLPEGCVHPAGPGHDLAELRLHPGELSPADLASFIPAVATIAPGSDPRPGLVAAGLAATVTVHAVATELLEHEPWDFAAVRYHLLEPLSQTFMPFRPPRLPGVTDHDALLYGGVVDAGYGLLDAMLGRLVELAGPDTILILVSDHGFRSGADRPAPADVPGPHEPLACHAPLGIVVIAGPGVRADQLVHGAGLLDVAPTVLALLGLPVGSDMPGRTLAEAFAAGLVAERIGSWEAVAGECGRHPAAAADDSWREREAIRRLVAFGYDLESPAEQAVRLAAEARKDLHRAFAHLDAGEADAAIAALRRVVAAAPGSFQSVLLLASTLLSTGAVAECRRLAEAVVGDEHSAAYRALILGMAAAAEGRDDEAHGHYAAAEKLGVARPFLLDHVAWAHLKRGRFADARRGFEAALAADPNHVFAPYGLAVVHLAEGRAEEAAGAALDAVGRRYFWPEAHAVLGLALVRLRRIDRAIRAFETSLGQRPTPLAREWLERLRGPTAAAGRGAAAEAAARGEEAGS